MCVPIELLLLLCELCQEYCNNVQYFGNLVLISTVVLYEHTVHITYLGSTFEIHVFGIHSTYQFCITYSMYFVVA